MHVNIYINIYILTFNSVCTICFAKIEFLSFIDFSYSRFSKLYS